MMHRQGSLTDNHNTKTQFTQKPKGSLKLYIVGTTEMTEQRCTARNIIKKQLVNEPIWGSVDPIQATGDVPVYQHCDIGTTYNWHMKPRTTHRRLCTSIIYSLSCSKVYQLVIYKRISSQHSVDFILFRPLVMC